MLWAGDVAALRRARGVALGQRGDNGASDFAGSGRASKVSRSRSVGQHGFDGAPYIRGDLSAAVIAMLLIEPIQHHGGREDGGDRIGHALARDVGALPCEGWKRPWRSLTSAEGASPRPPTMPAAISEVISPNWFSLTTTSKRPGSVTSSMQPASM